MAGASPFRTFLTRLFGLHTDERAWGRGAEGEERVGELLEQLRPLGWSVEHDVKIGRRGANVDHLVIGPPGVYVINTKLIGAEVWVGDNVVKVDGYRKAFVDKLEAEALRVRQRLLSATGFRKLWVQGLLVFVSPTLTIQEQPQNVRVLTDNELVPVLRRQMATLEEADLKQLVRAARQASTWT
ncbi:MAG: NERD domain-containing protein [Myxococcaceae bacterium]|nr:MAG: NERD domain-containing protein [Myxococcaceae bacterium]